MLSREELEPTAKDKAESGGCNIVANWTRHQLQPWKVRAREVCRKCPLHNGSYPRAIPAFETALVHLRLVELQLAPSRDQYTRRQITAIYWVDQEMKRVRREIAQEKT